MTIETKFNTGETVYVRSGGIIHETWISEINTRSQYSDFTSVSYRVSGLTQVFAEDELFSGPEPIAQALLENVIEHAKPKAAKQ